MRPRSEFATEPFEVPVVEGLGKRFPGRKTVVEDNERIMQAAYDLVGVDLKAWQAAPPKPVKARDTTEDEMADEPFVQPPAEAVA